MVAVDVVDFERHRLPEPLCSAAPFAAGLLEPLGDEPLSKVSAIGTSAADQHLPER